MLSGARACSCKCVFDAMIDLANTLNGAPSPFVTFPPASVRMSAPAAMSHGLSWYSQYLHTARRRSAGQRSIVRRTGVFLP